MLRTRSLPVPFLPIVILFIVLPVFAQLDSNSLETVLASKMKGKMLSLRVPSASERLRFDANGGLIGEEKHGVASLDRDIIVLAVKLHDKTVGLDGERVYYSLDAATNALIPNVQAIPAKIEIDMPAGGISEASVDTALTKIFLTVHELQQQRCTPSETERSRDFLIAKDENKTTTNASETAAASKSELSAVCFPTGERAYLIGKGVRPPKAVSAPNPAYSDYARLKRIQGTALYAILIDQNGLVSDALLVRSIEPSLNFNGVVALRSWRFRPATFEGEAVRSAVHVEINFRLY